MRQPSLDELLDVVDNKYALVVITAKRARAITDHRINSGEGNDEEPVIKPVTQALVEIAQGEVSYKYPEKKKPV